MPKRYYIMSAHDDAQNMFNNAVGMTVNKWNKGKRRIDPVFKSEGQRKSFKRHSIVRRNQLIANIAAMPHVGVGADPRIRELRAVRKLNRLAQPGTALRDFGGDNRTRPRIFVQGHGMPGATPFAAAPAFTGAQATIDDQGGIKTVRQTSRTLKRMRLPRHAKIRANSCWSATQHDVSSVQAMFHVGVLGNPLSTVGTGPPLATFGGNLTHELRNVGRTKPHVEVGGFPGPTTQGPWPGVQGDLVTPTHGMGTLFGGVPALGVGPILTKRGHTKRMF
ncbi:MAG TPA: hypothetical protein VI653_19660 [Steroidobacteraceae bacterium]